MGWFSKEKVVNVSTSVSRVIEDKKLPNALKTGVIKGIMTDEGEQLIENILEEQLNSTGILCERMYRYAKDKYINGLPVSTFLNTGMGEGIIQTILSNELNQEILIDYCHYGSPNNQHLGWEYLVNEYGYEHGTNEITRLSKEKGYTVYLENMQVVVKDATPEEFNLGYLAQWGSAATEGYTPLRPTVYTYTEETQVIPQTPIVINSAADGDYFIVTYVWQIGRGSYGRESFTFPLPTMNNSKNYFQAKYYWTDPSTFNPITWETTPGKKNIRYFTYEEDSGKYPELDEVYSTQYTELGSFFPFAYFRRDFHSLTTDKSSEQYKANKKLLKKLKLPYDPIAAAIDENPNIGDVHSAILMMAVPANTSNAIERQYLFEFFKEMYFKTGAAGVNISTSMFSDIFNRTRPKISVAIQDKLFNMIVSATSIRRFTRAGVKAKEGEVTSSTGSERVTRKGVVNNDGTFEETIFSWDVTYHSYIKQTSAFTYEEIRVYELQTAYYVGDGYYASQTPENTANLLIPLDHSITKEYKSRDREELYSRSLHYVFNAMKITYLAWYQQQWFATVVLIVAIVWTIFSLGSDGGSSISGALAMMGSMTLEALIIYILSVVVTLYLEYLIVKTFVRLIGAEAALVVAVVLAAYGLYDAYSFGSVQGAPWAQELLSISTNLVSASTDAMANALLGIKSEAEAFGLEVQEKTKLLEEAKSLLEGNNLLNPFLLFGESPKDFYQRTVHSGNIGTVGISAISSYVDIALTLPKLYQTIDMV